MAAHATILAKPTQRRQPSTRREAMSTATCLPPECIPGLTPHRRYDIDQAILRQLNPHPKTAHRLWRDLNPHIRRTWRCTPQGWKNLWLNVAIDYRTLMRHVGYLRRDGLITQASQLKILVRDDSQTAWLVKYYFLKNRDHSSTPPSTPPEILKPVAVIHNPFYGPEGATRFMRWLAEPQI